LEVLRVTLEGKIEQFPPSYEDVVNDEKEFVLFIVVDSTHKDYSNFSERKELEKYIKNHKIRCVCINLQHEYPKSMEWLENCTDPISGRKIRKDLIPYIIFVPAIILTTKEKWLNENICLEADVFDWDSNEKIIEWLHNKIM